MKYRPYPALLPFLKSKAPIRVLAGGNRTSKTSCGAHLLACYANGSNPYTKEKYPVPNLTWAVALDHQSLGLVMRDTIKKFMPPGTRFRAQPPAFLLPNGSEIHLKSSDPSAGFEKFQGSGILACWIDEEPMGENGRAIFHEIYARRAPGIPLHIWMTFTPLQGYSWSYKELWDPESSDRFPGVETFTVTQLDASVSHGGFWSDKELADFQAGYSEAEWDARVMGKFGLLSGASYYSGKLLEETRERIKAERGVKHTIRAGSISTVQVSEDASGHLTIYRPPVSGRQYIMGVDCAGGVGQDASVCSVWDRTDLACCAVWHSNRVDANQFGSDAVLPLAKYYNNALVVLEVNSDHGGSVLNELRSRYHNLYRQRKWSTVRREYSMEYGWRTTSANRTAVYDALAKALREGHWVPDVDLLTEMGTVVKREGERIDHLEGYHDDRVFAAGLALSVHYDTPVYTVDYSKYRKQIPRGENGWLAV